MLPKSALQHSLTHLNKHLNPHLNPHQPETHILLKYEKIETDKDFTSQTRLYGLKTANRQTGCDKTVLFFKQDKDIESSRRDRDEIFQKCLETSEDKTRNLKRN
ncbi:hypothetical protein HELRODRAFT_165502 [Helobdella robusta]|uniref:Uncharacterized protein n=1 Tax=Helobdella robusta TaxID=6412 RepID=T1EWX4_HELRO|nr:hypothetical protein HELRODRAFT_165502 [Helobdella robusta]ESN91464.1 hypothetical protein HELRODRAFT_165502 [Helobdella robusta]